jgi:hypothetical protein
VRPGDDDRYFGKYRGTVADNEDPAGAGRLRAYVPEVLHDVPSGWALPCAPYASAGSGLYAIPPPEAGVWIEFESGYVSRPIWSGCWWAEGEVPHDERDTASAPARRIWRSGSGLLVSLDDDRHTLTVSDRNGRNLVRVQVDDGTVEVRGDRLVVLEAPQIKQGAGAAQAAVLGDDLVSYLSALAQWCNSHVHTLGSPFTSAPVPPFMSQPRVLSTKNRVE